VSQEKDEDWDSQPQPMIKLCPKFVIKVSISLNKCSYSPQVLYFFLTTRFEI